MSSILVVELEPRDRERIQETLRAEGWKVRLVASADQALQAAASEAPDLVVVSADVPGIEAVASSFSRNAGGPGVVGLLPRVTAGGGVGALEADDLLAKPFSDQELLESVRRLLAARRQTPPAPVFEMSEHKLTSQDIFGDVLAEMEGELPAAGYTPPPVRPPSPAQTAPPAVAASAAPRPPAPNSDEEIQRKLEKTLSGVFGGPEPKPRAPAPPASPPVSTPPAPPVRKPAAAAPGDIDALLSKTLSNLDLGARTRPAAAPSVPSAPSAAPSVASAATAAVPRPASPAPVPAPRPAPPVAIPPPAAPAASIPPVQATAEGTAVRKSPKMVGDFDFSEIEELARTSRRAEPGRPAAPAPAAPQPAPVRAVPATPRPAAVEAPTAAPPAPVALQAPAPAAPPAPAPPPRPAPAPVQASVQASVQADVAATQWIPVVPRDEPGEPGLHFGQYTLLERIAVGGMAEVWKARMRGVEGFQKTVAIKKILAHMTDNAEFIGMFIDEAKLAAQLNHPNITHIYDLGKIGRDYYIAMEYVEGKDLRSLLNAARRRGVALPLGLALLIAARIANALDHAHRQRDFEGQEMSLVHRDVSPQNVLLTNEGDVKLCDFGIAKAVSKVGQTQMGALKGKLQYMSPEQAWGRQVDSRSDIFSLGAVLFEMLTGERLFAGDSEISVLEAVRNGKTRRPRQVDPGLPAEADDIVGRALAVEPQERFASAGEMAQRIEAMLRTLTPAPSHTDLAAFIRRVMEPEAPGAPEDVGAEDDERAAAPPPASFPAPVPAAELPAPPPVPGGEGAPVEAVAPLGEVRVEEGSRKSRGLLYAVIAVLILAAILTFLYLSRRGGGSEAPVPESAPANPAAASGPAVSSPAPAPATGTDAEAPASGTGGLPVDVEGLVSQQVAKQEEELRRKLDAQEKQLQKELELAKASGKPAPAGTAEAPAPAASAPSPATTPAAETPPPPVEPPREAPSPEPEPPAAQAQAPPETPAPAPETARTPDPEASAPAPVRAGDLVNPGPGVTVPQLVSFPKPQYPPVARRMQVEGTVVVSVLVDENGKVQDARLAEPIKQKVGINEAALDVARAARFKPATKSGVRVKMWTRLRIPFKL